MLESNNNYRCAKCSEFPELCNPGKCECLAHFLFNKE